MTKNETNLNNSVQKILRSVFATGIWDDPATGGFYDNVSTAEHKATA